MKPVFRLRTIAAAAVSAAVGAAAAIAAPAAAHTELTGLDPAEGASVEAGAVVTLTFSTDLLELGAEAGVTDSAGTATALAVERPAANAISITLPEMSGGDAQVAWRVVAEDGHPVNGLIDYVVVGAATPSASPAPSSEPTASASADASAEPTVSASPSAAPSAEPSAVPEEADEASDHTTPLAVWIGLGVAIAASLGALIGARSARRQHREHAAAPETGAPLDAPGVIEAAPDSAEATDNRAPLTPDEDQEQPPSTH